jgi:hypothetical protein
MPRKKQPEPRKQIYDIGNGATVTIEWDENRGRPHMQHLDDAVLVNHVCASEPRSIPTQYAPSVVEERRGGNLMPVDSLEFQQRMENMRAQVGKAKPPGYVVPVETSQSLFGVPDNVALDSILGTAAAAPVAEE